MNWAAKLIGGRFHYGWLTVAVVFLVLLAAAGTRATPSVMMVPLEHQFGWSRATVSLAISVNIALYGLMGPFAAAAGILSLIVVLLDMIVLSSRIDERGRPRWPWEKRD